MRNLKFSYDSDHAALARQNNYYLILVSWIILYNEFTVLELINVLL